MVLAIALCMAGPGLAYAQDAEPVFERPAPEAITEMFAETQAALGQGRKTVAADLLMEIIEDSLKQNFHAEAHARLGVVLMELDLPTRPWSLSSGLLRSIQSRLPTVPRRPLSWQIWSVIPLFSRMYLPRM
jgi:hypothetical protein